MGGNLGVGTSAASYINEGSYGPTKLYSWGDAHLLGKFSSINYTYDPMFYVAIRASRRVPYVN